MRKVVSWCVFSILTCFPFCISALVTQILASEFNRTYSNANPLIVDETTIIELDESIIFLGLSESIKAGAAFGQDGEDRLIFNSINPQNRVEVETNATWVLTTFSTPNHIVQFTGIAELIFAAGSTLLLGGGQLIMSDTTQIRAEPPPGNC